MLAVEVNGDESPDKMVRIKKRLTPRFTRARRAYTLRLAQSGEINLNKNLAWDVGCKRFVGPPFTSFTTQ